MLVSERDGGDRQVFVSHVVEQQNALVDALHLLYRLAKEEVALHTTKFNLNQSCYFAWYLHELNLGRNTRYSSEQIIAEMFQCLSQGANPI